MGVVRGDLGDAPGACVAASGCIRCCIDGVSGGGDAGCLLVGRLDSSSSGEGAVCTTDYCPAAISFAAVAAVVAVAWLRSLPLT